MVRSTPSKNAPAKGMNQKHKVALWVLAAFMAVQIWFHTRVGRPGLEEEDLVECLGSAAGTPQCFEARTFTLWHEQHHLEPLEDTELGEAPDAEIDEQAEPENHSLPVRPHILEALRAVTGVAKDEAAQAREAHISEATKAKAMDDAAQEEGATLPHVPHVRRGHQEWAATMQHLQQIVEVPAAAPQAPAAAPVTAPGAPKVAANLELEEASEEVRGSFDEAYAALMHTERWASYDNTSGQEDSAWAHELVDLQGRLEGRMKTLKLLQHPAAHEETPEPHHTDIHAWTRDLDILEAHLRERADELIKRRHARQDAQHAKEREERAQQLAQEPTDEAPAAEWEQVQASLDALVEEANASDASPVQEEPAAAPKHVSAWANNLEKFQAELEAKYQAGKERREAHRALMHSHSRPTTTAGLEQRIWDYGEEMCRDPARKDYAACAQFRVHHVVTDDAAEASEATTAAPAGLRHHVYWSAVKDWVKLPHALRSRGTVATVSRREARRVDWAGALPKVACVAVVPKGKDITHELRYIVDNFALQNYEGQKQLVIVANSDDQAARRALAKYADGESVKAVFSQGDEDLSVAYRFGAWSAKDADVVARWDLDAWHHPSRLALQIHSLVLARRPASHLRSWTTRRYGDDGATEIPHNESLGEPSLVGEREWMSRFWYPTLEVEREGYAASHGRFFVELEDPDLLVFQA